MSELKIKVGVDVRDLKISATGARSYLESLLFEFKKPNNEFEFYFLDTKKEVYIGNNILLKLKEQFDYFYWKQIQLPRKAKKSGCKILFCSDFLVPLYSSGIKTIPVFHDAFFWEYPQHYNKIWLNLFKLLGLSAAKKAPYIITPTNYTKNQLLKYTNINVNQLVVVGEGPKTISKIEEVTISREINKIIQYQYILHVGTFEKRKNLPFLVNAFKFVQQNGYPNLKLVLVGKNSSKITLDDSTLIKETIINAQLQDSVILTGYLNDHEVEKIYQHAILYVFPSVNEGFGIPVLEAFKYRIPVLIANNSCLQEIAENAALSFNPYDQNDLINAILKILNDNSLREKFTQLGTDRLKHFSWDKSAKELMHLFKKAIS